MSTVKVSVPATTANLGPGFDCIGAALNQYNYFTFSPIETKIPDLTIAIKGKEAPRVSCDRTNLVYQSFLKLYQYLGQTPPKVAINIELGIPLARGLGSSATAIVGGLIGGNKLAGEPLSLSEIMELAITIEGHPDNVVPALLGNCQLSVEKAGNWQICPIVWHPDLIPVVVIPDFELSTQKARAVLPTHLSRHDAIFNIAHLGLLIKGLETGNRDWLMMALDDKLHQPYRQTLIKGYNSLKKAALSVGAYGLVISGAGPTVIALTSSEHAEQVSLAITDAWMHVGVKAEALLLSIDFDGARVVI
ncbi:MAG: homoserine kinase [cyanobacterium endosymbiont of Rhopalodia musculus]|uniref:homoserine kinase n=1 Tax=cyanobacterium endosymbiont of Epithemia clementina EcSB TaxID=3034674 RepID=UPI00248009B2|nr:homoserine kinase [cyanobacterium endosymbiont of Epithemia clementina EcSB]WGT67886.1 homoserine kinase [cyanobacterium endosymbiont of Epithemia clementina EcSB]